MCAVFVIKLQTTDGCRLNDAKRHARTAILSHKDIYIYIYHIFINHLYVDMRAYLR